MSRNRIIYQSLGLMVGPTPSTGVHTSATIKQLQRITSVNFSNDVPLEDVTVFGQLSPIDQLQVESPTVPLDFTYYAVDAKNEQRLGFDVNTGTSVLGSILNKTQDDKNYFVLIADEGTDLIGEGAADLAVIGIGNGFITSYNAEGAVGGFPSVTVNVEGLNIRAYADGVAEVIPAVNPNTGLNLTGLFTVPDPIANDGATQAAAIQKGDISLTLTAATGLFQNISDVCLQSYNISFDLSRENQDCLGSRYARSREPQFPIDITMNIEFLASDIATGNLADILCGSNSHDLIVNLRQPNCQGTGAIAKQYTVKNAKYTNQQWSASVGPAQTVSITYVAKMSATNDTANGLFISGITGYS
jgi:hypothetical protein